MIILDWVGIVLIVLFMLSAIASFVSSGKGDHEKRVSASSEFIGGVINLALAIFFIISFL